MTRPTNTQNITNTNNLKNWSTLKEGGLTHKETNG